MTKKSALAIAGGLAAALLAGVAALSINMGIMRASGAPIEPGSGAGKPIVKTITKTIHVKPKAKKPGPVKTIVVRGGGTGSMSSSSSSSLGGSEREPEHEFGESDDD